MPKFFPSIPEEFQSWILEQPVFWVGTAPKHGKHINVSPKGTYTSLLLLHNANKLSYVDLTGSGSETISHLYDNGRITIMFNSFTAAPRIMRLFGAGKVTERDEPGFEELLDEIVVSAGKRKISAQKAEGEKSEAANAEEKGGEEEDGEQENGVARVTSNGGEGEDEEDYEIGTTKIRLSALRGCIRAIITVDIFTCQLTCGYGVPTVATATASSPAAALPATDSTSSSTSATDTQPQSQAENQVQPLFSDRPGILKANEKLGKAPMKPGKMRTPAEEYWVKSNLRSLDQLPGTKKARMVAGENILLGDAVAFVRRWREGFFGVWLGVVITLGLMMVLGRFGGAEGGTIVGGL